MKKKILAAVTILGVFVGLVSSCTNGVSTPVPPTGVTSPPENNPTNTPVVTTLPPANNPGGPSITATPPPVNSSSGSSSTIQSGVPLTVTEPADGATINGDSVTVQGKTEPGATISVNDNVVTADATGVFSVNVILVQGPNAVDVIATDDNGNEGEVLLMVNAVTGS